MDRLRVALIVLCVIIGLLDVAYIIGLFLHSGKDKENLYSEFVKSIYGTIIATVLNIILLIALVYLTCARSKTKVVMRIINPNCRSLSSSSARSYPDMRVYPSGDVVSRSPEIDRGTPPYYDDVVVSTPSYTPSRYGSPRGSPRGSPESGIFERRESFASPLSSLSPRSASPRLRRKYSD